MKIIWSPAARTDLEEVWRYIATDSVNAATLVENRIIDAVDGLSVFPETGRRLRGGLRQFVVAKTGYLIIYRVKAAHIEIARVWHGAREPFA
ncbi:type II toxin-antitoxin system RelE/ParE family toxin [Brevundimonas intermedia]|uniref:Type II toxin-antitoxin system RelE/ParE family toxin n=1 Tax=Brevundimonas intermedia TaxID=74315 RepID=A0A4Y9RX58_9CAUL|nr:type II toxin-antitoxin system RelE/ParE family toxin [Brevundimonas intermedia]TFW12239.1 type II toxin-antitoxin system RelE/ParE family toxin [Brevundimonas intermedia]